METIVRLESLRFQNLKNVNNGELFFSERKELERGEYDEEKRLSSVLGIYGQNGSGKTTALNALRLIQNLLGGSYINPIFSGYINVNETELSVGADFFVKTAKGNYYVYYDIEIHKNDNQTLDIANERLSYFKYGEGERKNNFYEFVAPSEIKKSFAEKLSQNDKAIYQYLCSNDTSGSKNGGFAFSSIFNPKTLNIIANNKANMDDFAVIVGALFNFAKNNLAIYAINYFNKNENVGIRFRVKDQIRGADTVGDIFVPFTPSALESVAFSVFEKIIAKINKVMPAIIPGYAISITKTNNPQFQKLTNMVEFFLTSKRGDGKPIALLYESNGIKKIISILSGLIDAYSHEGTLMAIDEIDSGIFEYLLGEIVYSFENFGKGQLMFTSHNMRVLEKVNYKNIFFTTTDHKKAFTQLTNIRNSNNLRDMYYRLIANGCEGDTKLYDMVKTEELIGSLFVDGE